MDFTVIDGSGNSRIRREFKSAWRSMAMPVDGDVRVELNRHARSMHARRRADIDDLGLRNRAVWHHGEIPLRGQDMRGAPIQLDDLAFGSTLELDPIVRSIGTAEAEHQAGEHVAQRTLQGEAQDD